MGDADLADLEALEFTKTSLIRVFAEMGRVRTSNGGLILAQGAYDIRAALLTIPCDGNGYRMANRVARHVFRAADQLHAAQLSLAKVPRAYKDVYQNGIQARRPRRQIQVDD